MNVFILTIIFMIWWFAWGHLYSNDSIPSLNHWLVHRIIDSMIHLFIGIVYQLLAGIQLQLNWLVLCIESFTFSLFLCYFFTFWFLIQITIVAVVLYLSHKKVDNKWFAKSMIKYKKFLNFEKIKIIYEYNQNELTFWKRKKKDF